MTGQERAVDMSPTLQRLTVLIMLALVSACAPPGAPRTTVVDEGDPRLGAVALVDYGCISCHTVPGIDNANGLVGPPLTAFGRRAYIAGQLPNSQANLVRWIMDPQDVEPGTAMPDLGVSRIDALNMSAYLLSLD